MVTFGSLTAQEAGDGAIWFPWFEARAVNTKTRVAGGGIEIDRPAAAFSDLTGSFPIRLDETTSSLQDWLDACNSDAPFETDDGAQYATLDAVTGIRIYRDQSVTFATLELTAVPNPAPPEPEP